ncbi:MAG TPA: alpha/beta fold hydrolase [Anaerolineales bacterium]|nr:alpha/beta fold hydrolase [Anaerolineales bacterium]
MMHESVSFHNQNIKLVGTLFKPNEDGIHPAIVVVHSASGGERTDPFYDHLKIELPKRGIAVLVFDRRGSGDSQGDFATADFDDLADDVVAAVEYLESRADIDRSRISLHGTSQGGWIAPHAAAKKPDIACVVAVSASGVSPAEQMDYGVAFHLKQDDYDHSVIDKVVELRTLVNEYFRGNISREEVAAELSRYESELWFRKGYLYPSQELPVDITQDKWHYEMDYEPLSIWKKVNQSTLFLFAEVDEWVPIEQGMKNYESATSHLNDVTFKRIKGTNHLMSMSQDEDRLEISREYLDILLDWLRLRLIK